MKFKWFSVAIGFLVLAITACSNDSKMSNELKKDLELASTSEGLALASNSNNRGQQIVSLAEQNKPAPRAPAAATLAPRPRRVSQPAPEPEYVEEEVEQSTETTAEIVDQAPTIGDEQIAGSSPRPQPVGSGYPGGRGGGTIIIGGNGGIGIGDIIGVAGVVIRGGTVGGDHCPPPGRGGRRPVRIPGTYPGRWYSLNES